MLYSHMLGISFKEETDGYLHTEALKGANSFACGRFRRQHSPAWARIPGLRKLLRPKLGSNLMLRMSNRQLLSLNRKDIECS